MVIYSGHIKTGTTSVQRILPHCSGGFILIDRISWIISDIIQVENTKDLSKKEDAKERIVGFFQDLESDDRKIIYSDESLFADFNTFDYKKRMETLMYIFSSFSPRFVIVSRKYNPFLKSYYKEAVLSGTDLFGLGFFLNKRSLLVKDYSEQMRRYFCNKYPDLVFDFYLFDDISSSKDFPTSFAEKALEVQCSSVKNLKHNVVVIKGRQHLFLIRASLILTYFLWRPLDQLEGRIAYILSRRIENPEYFKNGEIPSSLTLKSLMLLRLVLRFLNFRKAVNKISRRYPA